MHGPRLYIAGLRIHHGLFGIVLAIAGAAGVVLVGSLLGGLCLFGAALIVHDWADRWWPLLEPAVVAVVIEAGGDDMRDDLTVRSTAGPEWGPLG